MIPRTDSPAQPPSDTDAVESASTAMALLASRRRRAVLQFLERTDGTATLAELADEIARRETPSDPTVISDHGGVSARERRAVRISLHHTHVPKLAAAGAVEYDSATKTVSLCDRGRILSSRRAAVCESLE